MNPQINVIHSSYILTSDKHNETSTGSVASQSFNINFFIKEINIINQQLWKRYLIRKPKVQNKAIADLYFLRTCCPVNNSFKLILIERPVNLSFQLQINSFRFRVFKPQRVTAIYNRRRINQINQNIHKHHVCVLILVTQLIMMMNFNYLPKKVLIILNNINILYVP